MDVLYVLDTDGGLANHVYIDFLSNLNWIWRQEDP